MLERLPPTGEEELKRAMSPDQEEEVEMGEENENATDQVSFDTRGARYWIQKHCFSRGGEPGNV